MFPPFFLYTAIVIFTLEFSLWIVRKHDQPSKEWLLVFVRSFWASPGVFLALVNFQRSLGTACVNSAEKKQRFGPDCCSKCFGDDPQIWAVGSDQKKLSGLWNTALDEVGVLVRNSAKFFFFSVFRLCCAPTTHWTQCIPLIYCFSLYTL